MPLLKYQRIQYGRAIDIMMRDQAQRKETGGTGPVQSLKFHQEKRAWLFYWPEPDGTSKEAQ